MQLEFKFMVEIVMYLNDNNSEIVLIITYVIVNPNLSSNLFEK